MLDMNTYLLFSDNVESSCCGWGRNKSRKLRERMLLPHLVQGQPMGRKETPRASCLSRLCENLMTKIAMISKRMRMGRRRSLPRRQSHQKSTRRSYSRHRFGKLSGIGAEKALHHGNNVMCAVVEELSWSMHRRKCYLLGRSGMADG